MVVVHVRDIGVIISHKINKIVDDDIRFIGWRPIVGFFGVTARCYFKLLQLLSRRFPFSWLQVRGFKHKLR